MVSRGMAASMAEVEALLAAGAKAEATLRAERTRAADVFIVAKKFDLIVKQDGKRFFVSTSS
jgi:hypothetical protein